MQPDGKANMYGEKKRWRGPKHEQKRARRHAVPEKQHHKKYSSEEEVGGIPDSAYFYHQMQRDGNFPDSVEPVYDEFDPRGGVYVGLDGMGMEDEAEAEGQRPSGESEEDSDSLDSKDKPKQKSIDLSSKHSLPAQSVGSTASLNYQNIIEQEQLYDQMSLDNYAILLHLIHQGEKDIRQIFKNHARHRDVMVLNIELNSRTEEALQLYLQKYLKADDVKKVRKLRQAKSQEYLQIFRKFIPGMMGERQLMDQLRALVRGTTTPDAAASAKTTELLVDPVSEQDSDQPGKRYESLIQAYLHMVSRADSPHYAARDKLLWSQLAAGNPQLIGMLETEAGLSRALVQRLDEFCEQHQASQPAYQQRDLAAGGGLLPRMPADTKNKRDAWAPVQQQMPAHMAKPAPAS
jgi:hypothetical protein